MTEPTQAEIVNAMCAYAVESLTNQAIAAMLRAGLDPVSVEAARPKIIAKMIAAVDEHARPDYEDQVRARRGPVH